MPRKKVKDSELSEQAIRLRGLLKRAGLTYTEANRQAELNPRAIDFLCSRNFKAEFVPVRHRPGLLKALTGRGDPPITVNEIDLLFYDAPRAKPSTSHPKQPAPSDNVVMSLMTLFPKTEVYKLAGDDGDTITLVDAEADIHGEMSVLCRLHKGKTSQVCRLIERQDELYLYPTKDMEIRLTPKLMLKHKILGRVVAKITVY